MKVLILGGNGMLGHKAFEVFSPLFETWATVRSSKERLQVLPVRRPHAGHCRHRCRKVSEYVRQVVDKQYGPT